MGKTKKRPDGRYVETATVTLPGGRKKRKFFYGTTAAEARRKMVEYTGEITRGRPFSVVSDEWWEKHQKAVKYNTAEGYRAPLKDVKAYFDDWAIDAIEPADIQKFIYDYGLQGAGLKPRARHTVELRVNVLSLIFKYALQNRDVSLSPVQGIEIPAVCPTAVRLPPERSTMVAIEKDAGGSFTLYPALLLFTGMRRCEALGLTWEDVDWDARKIYMRRMVEFHGNAPVVREYSAKSKAGVRSVPLMAKLLKIMAPLQGEGLIFPGKSGGIMTKGEYCAAWKRLGLGVTAHQLRHAYAGKMHDAGLDAVSSKVILGVSSASVVQDIYTHLDELKAADEALGKLDAAESPQKQKTRAGARESGESLKRRRARAKGRTRTVIIKKGRK